MEQSLLKVGISQGDINGIGYEILMKVFRDEHMLEFCTPIIYGSLKAAGYHRKAMNIQSVNISLIQSAEEAGDGRVNLIDTNSEEVHVTLGTPTKEAGEYAFQALERSIEDLKKGDIDVLVTLPINKSMMQSEHFSFPGHTEYLQNRLAEEGESPLMILASGGLRVALVTGHIPVSKISETITQPLVEDAIRIFNKALERDFGIDKPRIAVLALNPHAGDNGVAGLEEQNIIIPAINACDEEGILAFGPYPADGFFGTEKLDLFDGVLAMYHDQGLAPFKTLAMKSGVNVTSGLPFVRTSPSHGTAYDIAGKGIASETSLREAIYMAIDIYRNRERYDEPRRNPLRKLYFERGSDNVRLDLTKDEE